MKSKNTLKFMNALFNGEQLTEKQIASRFGIANPRATVSNFRLRDGLAIYANRHVDSNGRETTKYRLGTPTRSVVAAGYRARSLGLV
jgi:hypothetical protein